MEDPDPDEPSDKDRDPPESTCAPAGEEQVVAAPDVNTTPSPQGKLIIDATVAPQNITYPTDLKLLCAARR